MKHVVLQVPDATTHAGDALRDWTRDPARRIATRPCTVGGAMPRCDALSMAVLDANPDHILLVDAGARLLWANKAARVRQAPALTRQRSGLPGCWPRLPAGPMASAIAAATRGESPHFATSSREAGGRCWWDVRVNRVATSGDPDGQFLVVARDVTAQHYADAAIALAASRDALTGLARRQLFDRRIETLIAADTSFCVMVLNLDAFRERNDALGRAAGDAILRTVASRLARGLALGESAARLGGDEFGVVLLDGDGGGAAALNARARQLMARLAKPMRTESGGGGMPASAGVAHYPADGDTAALLCSHAESALIEAKAGDRGGMVAFDPVLHESQAARNTMLDRAECALAGRNILPHYQPIVDLRTGRVVGFEALLRWRSPTGSIELPGAIWPAFAVPALSRRLTEAMLGQVVADLVRWRRQGILLPVAINVSDADLRTPDFAVRLLARLETAGLPASCLQIELTETAVLGRHTETLAAMLHSLKAAGMRIALDDFGTGYASLLHLKLLPVDVIKIDRSFVAQLGQNPEDRAIIKAMLSMATHLGIGVVAEGIENAAQAQFLTEHGCALGQGFLYARALPASAVPALLAAPARPPANTVATSPAAPPGSAGWDALW